MNESHAKPPSRRLVIIGSLVAAGIIGAFVLLPCTLRELGSRAALGRDISSWHQVESAIYRYHMDSDLYPLSLNDPDFQRYIDDSVRVFLREGRLAYYHPPPDPPRSFILIRLTTPRGTYSTRLDWQPDYPTYK